MKNFAPSAKKHVLPYNGETMISKIAFPKMIQFTQTGYQKVKDDIAALTEKRVGAVVNLRTACEMGDLSENGAYKAARFELSAIDRELRRLNYLLRFGKVVTIQHTGSIAFGSQVSITDGNKTLQFMLVDGYESDPQQQKLSLKSPIGKAIFGKKVGDKIVVMAPSGLKNYTIISVN